MYFLDYNWTKLEIKTTVPSITYYSISISLLFFSLYLIKL